MRHIDDWLDEPPKNDAEKAAKEWLELFRLPAYRKFERDVKKQLGSKRVSCMWQGKRWVCSGCSAMGDVWLVAREFYGHRAYQHRVNIEELSDWRVANQVPQLNIY